MKAELLRTPLYDEQLSMGAAFVELWGWLWTTSFGDPDYEYKALSQGVGITDVSQMAKWEFRGREALAAADRIHSNSVASMDVGQVKYGAFLDEGGHLVDDGCVFMFSADRCWVMTNIRSLEDYFKRIVGGWDVSITEVTQDLAVVSVQGPKSYHLLRDLVDTPLASVDFFRFIPHPVQVSGIPVHISRTGYSAELGYELFVDTSDAVRLWRVLVKAGAIPYGASAVDIERIEAGIVIHGFDYEPGVSTPYDISLDRLVALDKPTLIARDTLMSLAKEPPNRLATFRWQGSSLPPPKSPLTRDGEVVGVLTSPTLSKKFGAIGLGRIQSAAYDVGSALNIEAEGEVLHATVDRAPIDDLVGKRRRARLED